MHFKLQGNFVIRTDRTRYHEVALRPSGLRGPFGGAHRYTARSACTRLANLARDAEHRKAIAAAGGIAPLVATATGPTSPSGETMTVLITGCARGVGISLNKQNVIKEIRPESAAARAAEAGSGLLVGDKLLGVDDISLNGRLLTEVMLMAHAAG